MKRRRGTKIGATARQRAWWNSARFREMGRRNCRQFNAKQRSKPKCEAARRTDGEPCQQPAGPNGRCRYHGGATPAGKRWLVPTFPKADTTVGVAKFNRKLADLDRRARKRAKRLAAMTPEQRAAHDAWHKAHRPGPKGQRQAAKLRAKQNADIRALLATPEADVPPSLEMQRIQTVIAKIDRLLGQAEPTTTTYTEGVFG